MVRRLFSTLLVFALLLGAASPACAETYEQRYTKAVQTLTEYVAEETLGIPVTRDMLTSLWTDFTELGDYSFSPALEDYVEVLCSIEEGDFDRAIFLLTGLNGNEELETFLQGITLPCEGEVKEASLSIADLINYVNGRRAEAEGDFGKALAFYNLCPHFRDTYLRMMNIEAAQATPSPEPTKKPKPKATKKPASKPKDTPKPTPTPEPKWGDWTSWSTDAVPKGDDNRQSQTKEQYRYRDTITTVEYSWSGWSGWSTEQNWPQGLSGEQLQIESTTEPVCETKTKYSYSRWVYKGKNGSNWFTYGTYYGDNYVSGGEWQYKTTDTPLKKTKIMDGHQQYEGYWYYEKKEETTIQTGEITKYRYQIRSDKQVTVQGEWSGWSDDKPSEQGGREIQARKVYRTRTRVN